MITRLNVFVGWAMSDKACRCSFSAMRRVVADVTVEVRALNPEGKTVSTRFHQECGDGADLVVDDARVMARSHGWGFVLVDYTGLTVDTTQDPKEV